jgi:hypothetical protein
MTVNDESQSSFIPAGTGQMARARDASPLYFRKLPKYRRAERIKVLGLTQRQLATLMWPAPDSALYPCYCRPAQQGASS